MTVPFDMKKKKVKEEEVKKFQHLSEVELDQLIEEEPEITIKEYLALLTELYLIQQSIKEENG